MLVDNRNTRMSTQTLILRGRPIAAWASVVLTLMALGWSIIGLVRTSENHRELLRSTGSLDAGAIISYGGIGARSELLPVRREIEELRQRLAALTEIPEDSKVAETLAKLTENVGRHDARLKALDEAIQTSPEKALSLPLLRKDLEHEHAAVVADMAAVRAEVARMYDFNKWFFGLIATMAVSMLGFAFTQFRKRGKEEPAG